METGRARLAYFDVHADPERGNLTVVQGLKDIPFEIRRVFFVECPMDGIIHRGGHAHKETEQVIVCIKGDCNVTVESLESGHCNSFYLNNVYQGVYVPEKCRVDYTLYPKSAILVISSTDFDPDDYIFFDQEETP